MTDLTQLARSVIAARDRYGWSPEVDAEINKMRGALDSAQAGQEISDERIDYIAELVVKGMPEGIQGFCKSWGWRQFARALLGDCRGHYRAPEVAETASSAQDHRSSGIGGEDRIEKKAVSPAADEAGERQAFEAWFAGSGWDDEYECIARSAFSAGALSARAVGQ